MDPNPYLAPQAPPPAFEPPGQPPPVFTWYRIYCWAMAVIYLLVIGMGIVFLALDPETLEMAPAEADLTGFFYIIIGVVLAAIYLTGALVPAKKWGWIYGIIAISISMTSCACLPAAIPLLIFWLKAETKAFFRV